MQGCRLLLTCSLLLSSFQALAEQSTRKVDFKCDGDFESALRTNEVLSLAGVDVTQTPDGKTYLLALGTAINQAKESSEAKAKLDTRKVAEAKARKQAAEFLKTEVHTETKLTEIRNSERFTADDGIKQQFAKIIKIREEIIIQRSHVALGGSKVVATWFSEDNSVFNSVVAVQINGK